MSVDILIATPGRLAEHILHTPGFTLQHLLFLVIDEADRVLHQSFQNWTELVIKEILSPRVFETQLNTIDIIRGTNEIPIIGQRHVASVFKDPRSSPQKVRKLIFSATLTY